MTASVILNAEFTAPFLLTDRYIRILVHLTEVITALAF